MPGRSQGGARCAREIRIAVGQIRNPKPAGRKKAETRGPKVETRNPIHNWLSLHCNNRDCSPPEKKRRGFPFAHCLIPVHSALFRISSFGFRISGSAGLRSLWLIQPPNLDCRAWGNGADVRQLRGILAPPRKVEWSGGANMIRPMTSNVSALSSVVAKSHQAIHFVSSAPSIHSVRRVFPSTAGIEGCTRIMARQNHK